MKLTPYILCGGAGTRLSPLSTPTHPKPFLTLGAAHTLLAQTIARLDKNIFAEPYFVAVADCAHLIESEKTLIEPTARNTALSVARAAVHQQVGPMALLPSDHKITNAAKFNQAMKDAATLIPAYDVVLLGAAPKHPSTLYGYIEKGRGLAPNTFQVQSFKEKPNATLAQTYIERGNYLWNGGIFIFEAQSMIEIFARHQPEILACAKGEQTTCPALPFDRAIVEKLNNKAVVETDMGWRDLGSWGEVITEVQKNVAPQLYPWGAVYSFDTRAHLICLNGAMPAQLPHPIKELEFQVLESTKGKPTILLGVESA